jgi:D-glycero-alpha-D-manno-heptose-7-phosphate kinase
VGFIKAMTALRGQMVSKHELARKAIQLEQTVLKEHVGSQDQIAAAYGGFNVIRFLQNGDFQIEPVTIPPSRISELQSRLMLFYSGSSRLASEVAADVIANFQRKQAQLRQMRYMVDQALSILTGCGPLDDFGRLLHESWMLKRETAPTVTNSSVDRIYETAIEQGALGGKLLGAGGSGFMVFYVPPEKQADVLQALSAYLHVPFKFENEGSTLIYYGPTNSIGFAK